jgi:hypothetical protein
MVESILPYYLHDSDAVRLYLAFHTASATAAYLPYNMATNVDLSRYVELFYLHIKKLAEWLHTTIAWACVVLLQLLMST